MKNPWLSLWLSGANAWSGAARGMMAAEVKRTQNAMMAEAVRQTTAFWFPHAKSTGAKSQSRATRPRRRKAS